MLGTLSGDPQGLIIIGRWRMINMFYRIIELKDRDDLIQLLLGNMDFSLYVNYSVNLVVLIRLQGQSLAGDAVKGSHIMSEGTSSPCQQLYILTYDVQTVRIFSTKLLRKYATQGTSIGQSQHGTSRVAYWAIRLLVTQLYDPEVEVSEVAVQILQEACNSKQYLEYVVKCRPALDHLGEIGAPLLLR